MAEEASSNGVSTMEYKEDNTSEVSTEVLPNSNDVVDLSIRASQVISRLEEAATRTSEGGGMTWSMSSGFLGQPKPVDSVLSMIQDLVIHEDVPQTTEDGGEEQFWAVACLPELTEAARLAFVTHSVSAYAAALPRSHAQRLAGRLSADTTRWLSHIFRFVDCASSFHEDHLEGLVRITRLALYKKYPKFMEDGFSALSAAPPVIYSSAAAPMGISQHLCRQLSLPRHCVRHIPQNTMFGSRQTMDVSALERRLAEDSQSGSVTPLLVLAEVGSVVTGHCDNVVRLREICDKYNVWLHLRGHALAALALNDAPKELAVKLADSVTLPLGVWLGIPSLPVITLYRLTDGKGEKPTQKDTTLSLLSGLMAESLSRRLPTLPLWAALQVLGREGIRARLRQCFQVVEELYHKIRPFANIKFLSQPPGGGENPAYTVEDLSRTPMSAAQLFDIVASTLVFQFVPTREDETIPERSPTYYNKFNNWLGQILQRTVKNFVIEYCEIEQHGVVIRICCLESPSPLPTSDDVENIVSCLEQQIEILNATVGHRETFIKLVAQHDCLHFVDKPDWAGLGDVHYAPPTWFQIMPQQTKVELNRLNAKLVEALKNIDGAFSLGTSPDGLACVRFGMVMKETDLPKLVGLVVEVGKQVEADSKLLETVSEVVKRGIEAAQTDLERENAEKLWQEGILRHVPVVGTFVNWWSPPSKGGVRGRTLNLQAGTVESTENTYKFHMQLQPDAALSNSSGARTPPQPLVQTPVGTDSQSHSRSSSHSSVQSAKGNAVLANSSAQTLPVKEEVSEALS